jgi:hypothetical protein
VARKASGRAWRIGAARHYGSARNASGYSAVVAPGKFDAWAFGGTNPGGASVPVALRWNGSHWHAVPLPAGLSGFIGDASAPSGRDVWAVGYSGGYALHWNGSTWSVAKRWRHPGVLTGVTAVSSSDVWVFGTNTTGTRGLGTWHFDGHSWTLVPGLADQIHRASALSGRDIWAVAADSGGGGFVEHYTGQAWRRVPTSPALAGASLDDVVAASPRSVWVVGNQPSRGGEGRVIVGHFNGRRWSTTLMPWHADTGRLAPDGSGGVWISTVDAGPRTRALIGHLTRRGHLTWTSSRFGLGTGVSDIAPFRGARGVWLSGGFLTETGGDAAVWSVGTGPPRRPASHARGRVLAHSAPAA